MKHLWLGVVFLVACGDGKGADLPVDGGADAASPDAAVADAPPASSDAAVDAAIDAAPDAPPGAAVTVALAVPPVFTSHGPDHTVFATATNHTAAELALTVTSAGDITLVADGACDHVAAGASCAITLRTDNTTLGIRLGTLTVAGGGATATAEIAARVDAFVGATVVKGSGTVSFDPAPEAGCVGGGCYAVGTLVTPHQTPGAGFYLADWGPGCGSCTVAARATPIETVLSYLPGTPLHIDITGQGQVGVNSVDSFGFDLCTATCTIAVDPASRLDVTFSTPVEVTSVDGVAFSHPQSGGFETDYPAGTAAISVVFSPRPGEVDLVGEDLAFDRNNNVAIAALVTGGPETVTVYDPAMVAKWSVPGRRVAFTRTGELYVERDQAGTAVTTKFDASGNLLAIAATPLGFVTPDGGMLNPGPTANTITRRDATLTVISVFTLSAPYAGERGCLAMSGDSITASVTHPDDGEMSFDQVALDGTLVSTRSSIAFSCREVPDWDGGTVFSSFHPHETNASHDGFFVDDLNAIFDDLPYGAGVDLASNLYWMTSDDVSASPNNAQGGFIKKFTPPDTAPVTTLSRPAADLLFNGKIGIAPHKLAVAPDGRTAWVVTWYPDGNNAAGPNLIQIFAP